MDDVGVFIHWVPPSVSLLSLKAHSWFLSLSRYPSLSPTVSLSIGDHRGMGCSLSLLVSLYIAVGECVQMWVLWVSHACVVCDSVCVRCIYIHEGMCVW